MGWAVHIMRVLWCQWESMWPLQANPRACTTSVHMATPWIWLAMMKAVLLKPEISRILSYLGISWLPLRYGQRRLLLNSLEVFALCNMKNNVHIVFNSSNFWRFYYSIFLHQEHLWTIFEFNCNITVQVTTKVSLSSKNKWYWFANLFFEFHMFYYKIK